MNVVTGKTRPCGCAGSLGIPGSNAASKSSSSCGCGCSGCGSCAGVTPEDVGCTSGTPEATDRKGAAAASCMPPRPRFFPGELVSDFDLTAAVDYQRAQSLLSNGVIGGWGVYCGYSLSIDADACGVCVGPGIAFDARGRALVRSTATQLVRPAAADVGRPRDPCDPCVEPPPSMTLYLAVVYDDCLDAAKPRYGSACGPSADPGCDFSRVNERTRLVWINPKTVRPSYWTSGCLPDPCAEPEKPPRCEQDEVMLCPEPSLDMCTPEIGIHGGVGVDRYGRALQHAWNLRRNAAQVVSANSGEGGAECCGAGVGALIDVISGVACPACPGEAVVLLAAVTFYSDVGTKRPRIRVTPLRRRVLSNADLTYLVGYLLERALCRPEQIAADPVAPPTSDTICGDPCLDVKDGVERMVDVVLDKSATDTQRARAGEKIAYRMVMGEKRSLADMPVEELVRVAEEVHGRLLSRPEVSAVHVRYQDAAGRFAYETAAVELLDMLKIPELDGGKRAPSNKLLIEKYLIEQFARLRGTHRTIAWLPFLDLVREVYRMAEAELDEATIKELARDFPDAIYPDERVQRMAEQMAQEKLEQLKEELDRVKDELARIQKDAPTQAEAAKDEDEEAEEPGQENRQAGHPGRKTKRKG